MRKFILAFAALALLLSACAGAGGDAADTKYQTLGGVTSKSGDYCFQFEEEDLDSIPLAVSINGDSALVEMTIKLARTQEALKEGATLKPFYAVIHGRDAQDSIEVRLDADPASVDQVRAILEKPGDTVAVTFKGTMRKVDLDSINNKKVWTSLLL